MLIQKNHVLKNIFHIFTVTDSDKKSFARTNKLPTTFPANTFTNISSVDVTGDPQFEIQIVTHRHVDANIDICSFMRLDRNEKLDTST